jgi:AraC-like DNA-binding protein
MPRYREFAPPPRFSNSVECFWASTEGMTAGRVQRVVPDGCADIIYTRMEGKAFLNFVGPMRRFQDFPQAAGTCSVGIRFRPAMWKDIVRIDGTQTTDRIIPLADLWGQRAAELIRRLEAAEQPSQIVQFMETAMPTVALESPVQKAVRALESSRGRLSLDDAATAAGLSTRQFRRRCLELAGLSPKMLARILRFRHARSRIAQAAGRHAELAIECGYTDQSHLIAEFQEFAGSTPRKAVAEPAEAAR